MTWTKTGAHEFCTEASDLYNLVSILCPRCDRALTSNGTPFRDREREITHWVVVHDCPNTIGAKLTIFND